MAAGWVGVLMTDSLVEVWRSAVISILLFIRILKSYEFVRSLLPGIPNCGFCFCCNPAGCVLTLLPTSLSPLLLATILRSGCSHLAPWWTSFQSGRRICLESVHLMLWLCSDPTRGRWRSSDRTSLTWRTGLCQGARPCNIRFSYHQYFHLLFLLFPHITLNSIGSELMIFCLRTWYSSRQPLKTHNEFIILEPQVLYF